MPKVLKESTEPTEKKQRIKKTGTYFVVNPNLVKDEKSFDKQSEAESLAKAECGTDTEGLMIIRAIKTIKKTIIQKTKFEET